MAAGAFDKQPGIDPFTVPGTDSGNPFSNFTNFIIHQTQN